MKFIVDLCVRNLSYCVARYRKNIKLRIVPPSPCYKTYRSSDPGSNLDDKQTVQLGDQQTWLWSDNVNVDFSSITRKVSLNQFHRCHCRVKKLSLLFTSLILELQRTAVHRDQKGERYMQVLRSGKQRKQSEIIWRTLIFKIKNCTTMKAL